MSGSDDKKNTKWLDDLWQSLKFVGMIVAIFWILTSCARRVEEREQQERDEREEQLARENREEIEVAREEAQRETMDYVRQELPPLKSILEGYSDPEDIIQAVENGEMTAEDVAWLYSDFYYEIYSAYDNSGLDWK